MIDLIIEVPNAKSAFACIKPHASRVESIEPIHKDGAITEWRVIVDEHATDGGMRTIAAIVDNAHRLGFGAWPYEYAEGEGPWFELNGGHR